MIGVPSIWSWNDELDELEINDGLMSPSEQR